MSSIQPPKTQNNNINSCDDDDNNSDIENGEHGGSGGGPPPDDDVDNNNNNDNIKPSSSYDETRRTTETMSSNNDNSVNAIKAENVGQVFNSKFVWIQIIINLILGFLGPLATFYLLFGFLSQGPYEWSSGPLVGVVVGSLAGSPILIFALMPVGLPEAVEKGWFPKLSKENCQPPILQLFLDWKWATARNIAWTLLFGCILVPIALLIARYGLGPTLTTWELIWFNVMYEVVLAIPVVYIGLLGYSVHLDSILDRMSHNPNPLKRLLLRVLSSLKMSVCPS